MRDECDLRFDAKAAHMGGRHDCHLGNLFGRGILVDMCVGQEKRALARDQQAHRIERRCPGQHADNVFDMTPV